MENSSAIIDPGRDEERLLIAPTCLLLRDRELMNDRRSGSSIELLSPLGRRFYDRNVVKVARDLLGRRLIRSTTDGVASGAIVEVEAYLGNADPAAHSFRGETRRNATMFGPPGHLYVYSIHSRYCMNAVTEPAGVAHAVLIRAIEPLDGIHLMRARRGRDRPLDLARGPARLCEALAVDRKLDGWDLTIGEQIWIAEDRPLRIRDSDIGVSPRIGVTSAKDAPLRFFVDGHLFVSGPRRFHSRPTDRS